MNFKLTKKQERIKLLPVILERNPRATLKCIGASLGGLPVSTVKNLLDEFLEYHTLKGVVSAKTVKKKK